MNNDALRAIATVKLVRLSCGKHWGFPREDLTCKKCKHFDEQKANPKFRKGIQYGGTPWNAVLGE